MIWRIIVAAILIYIVVRRANLAAIPAKMAYSKRDYPKAMKIFKIADKIGNLNVNNKMLLGYVCLRCGELDEARKHLRLCSTLTRHGSAERNQINNLLALVSWKEGNLSDGIEILEEIIGSGYKTTVVYQNLGIFYNLSDDKEKALKFNLEAYDYNCDDKTIADNLGELYLILGENEKAKEVYAKLMEKELQTPVPYYNYGRVLKALGDNDGAKQRFEEALTKRFTSVMTVTREAVQTELDSIN